MMRQQQHLRDPTASAEVVRRLNTSWWDDGGTDEAFCEALAFVETELTGIAGDMLAPPSPRVAVGSAMADEAGTTSSSGLRKRNSSEGGNGAPHEQSNQQMALS